MYKMIPTKMEVFVSLYTYIRSFINLITNQNNKSYISVNLIIFPHYISIIYTH